MTKVRLRRELYEEMVGTYTTPADRVRHGYEPGTSAFVEVDLFEDTEEAIKQFALPDETLEQTLERMFAESQKTN